MEFKDSVRTCLNKYVDFQGRASRPEYWWFVLATFAACLLAALFDSILSGAPGLLYTIAILGLMLPNLAAQVRRLHDTDRSGWWVLLSLVPFVGGIIVLVWLCETGKPETNTYGPAPVVDEGETHKERSNPIFRAPPSDLDRLEKLHALHGSGALTPEEFAAEKAKLLNR